MRWKKYTIETTTVAEDFLGEMLGELGIDGIEVEDRVPLSERDQADMFIDFLPELPPDDGTSLVSFYVEDDGSDQGALLTKVKSALEKLRDTVDVGAGTITSSETEDLDWVNNWKKFFSSFTVGDIFIRPTWEAETEVPAGKTLIEIDPGISFGTGKHETTQLCIRQLDKRIAGHPRVLDIGCGSGILSIVALKLGAGEVVGTDVDSDCLTSTRDNLRTNGLDTANARFYLGNLIDNEDLRGQVGTGYDIAVANILADVIIPMAPAVFSCVKPGGCFISSGIIDFKEGEVKAALEAAGFAVEEIERQGEWVGIVAVRPEA
ncbi:MAG: 50S ribosomal protein L11 methyltransferase [Clostridiales bacterium]|nr:50S ribosomal protein L11 methyltransferase [Clostridiales bacterium]